MKLGAHFSIEGGLTQALLRAQKAKANTLQIFSSSPRTWQGPQINSGQINSFLKLSRQKAIYPAFIHAKYLVNLATPKPSNIQKSINSLVQDLNLSQKINGGGVIFHPRTSNPAQLIKGLKEVLNKTPKNTILILENMAQESLKDLGKIFKAVANRRLGFCYDTAHGFQHGYNLNDIFTNIKRHIGFQRLTLIHLNDSKTLFASKHDIHANIGQGQIRKNTFFTLLNHPLTANVPFILETPSFKKNDDHETEFKAVKEQKGTRLKKDFFLKPTLKVARELLGKYLIYKTKTDIKIGEITETEAYVGFEDKASHASKGETPRTKPMFMEGGRLYIYLIYGIYHCLNIVTEKRGYPAAVLIRKVKPVFGLNSKTDGPGKLCREFKLTKDKNLLDITQPQSPIFIADTGFKPEKILTGKRVGVDYAGTWKDKPWRFFAA